MLLSYKVLKKPKMFNTFTKTLNTNSKITFKDILTRYKTLKITKGLITFQF